MKQIDDCLNRVFENKKQLNTKWRATISNYLNQEGLVLTHYHHVILSYNLTKQKIEYAFWECPTDKRGLTAAIEYLRNKNYIVKDEELINHAMNGD